MYANKLANLLLQTKHGNPVHVLRCFTASCTKALHHTVCIQKDHATAVTTPTKNNTITSVHGIEEKEDVALNGGG